MKRLGLACTALIAWGGAAHAQLATIDIANVVNTGKMVQSDIVAAEKRIEALNNQVLQLAQLKATVEAISHGDAAALQALQPQLASLGLTSPLGNDMSGLVASLSGLQGAIGTTANLSQQLLATDQIYSPTAGDFRAIAINQAAAAVASQKAVAQLSLQSSAERLASLTALRQSLGPSTDLKAAADATARFTGEEAVAQAQGNQLLATLIMQSAQVSTDAAREQQMARCSAERLLDEARRASATAAAGVVQLITPANPAIHCNITPQAPNGGASVSYQAASYTPGATTPASSDGTTLEQMTAQSWGQQAADNATALGVNPSALAATCLLESNCTANPGGTGTISGAFQMSNGTYAQTVGEVQAANPDLASQITTKNDPASQSIAAAQYLKDGAQSLQAAGIANPSVLDVRGFYNFGPANGAALATAPNNQLMSDALSGFSAATLKANGISDTTTVGDWRTGVTNKIGAATASQSVLNGMTST